MREYKINVEQIEMLDLLENHTDSSIQTLAQGEINGKWYFGKELRIDNRQVDSVIIEDGTFLINEKMKFPQTKSFEEKRNEAIDHISNYGFRVGKPLLTPENYFSKQAILDYVNVVNVVSVGKKGMEEYYIKALKETTFNTLTTLTTQTTQTTQLAKQDNINDLRTLIKQVAQT